MPTKPFNAGDFLANDLHNMVARAMQGSLLHYAYLTDWEFHYRINFGLRNVDIGYGAEK